MNKINKVVSYISWQTNGGKEQLRLIINDLNKLKNTPLNYHPTLNKFYAHIITCSNLLKQFEKSFNLILQTGALTYSSLKRNYDIYLGRSFLHIKSAFDLFMLIKGEKEIMENNLCHEIYGKTYKVTLIYNELISAYQNLLSIV